jgi:hypothetical protein
MLFMRFVHYNPMDDPSGRLRLPLVLIWTRSTPLLAPPVFICSAGEWGGNVDEITVAYERNAGNIRRVGKTIGS